MGKYGVLAILLIGFYLGWYIRGLAPKFQRILSGQNAVQLFSGGN